MSNSGPRLGKRKTERLCLLLIGLIMALLFWKLFTVLQRDFADVNNRVNNGTMVNLNAGNTAEAMTDLLKKGMYFEDPKDIAFIAATVAAAKEPGSAIDNIGTLNKKQYFVSADEAFLKGGKSFRHRVELSRDLLGFSDVDSTSFEKEKKHPLHVSAQTNAGLGNYHIAGTIKKQDGQPAPNVLLRLRLLVPQESSSASDDDEKNIIQFKNGVRKIFIQDSVKSLQLLSFNAYARTDASGNYIFSGLPGNNSYEIIPLHPGYEFGRSKGIDKLLGNATFNFVESPHMMTLFSAKDFNILKKEKAFIVRTPTEVTDWFRIIVITFFCSFFLLHLIFSIHSPNTDQLLLPVIMILTGLSFITLFSLQDPLRDRFLVKSTFIYFCIGMAAILMFQFVNLKKFTPDSGMFRLFIFKNNRKAANGWPWALAATAFLCLTILFGTGPEGSGVKVNLFGFQPSEIVKYMVILFLGGFFALNEKFISEYPSFNKRLSFFAFSVIAIVATIFLFLVIGDLGPAIICCFTFIILFSFSRGDFMQVVAAMVLYAIATWIFKNVWMATGITVAALALYMLVGKKKLSESAVMALVVVSGIFITG